MRKIISLTCLFFLSAIIGISVFAQAQKPRYRGFTVCVYDYDSLKEIKDKWHANQVRYMMCPGWKKWAYKVGTSAEAMELLLKTLPELLDNCRKLDLAVIVDLHLPPTDGPTPPKKKFKNETEERNFYSDWWWKQKSNYQDLENAWKRIAAITAKYPKQDIWLELFNEPLNWADFPQGPKIWPEWAQKLTNQIRKIDKAHPILVASGPGQLWYGFSNFPPIKDPSDNIIYTLHMWQPFLYTHQGYYGDEVRSWPGEFNDGAGGLWNKKRIIAELYQAREFQKRYGVRLHVGEFGVARYAPNADKYLREVIDVFEKFGWDWNMHGMKEAEIWNIDCNELADVYRVKNGKKELFQSVVNEGMTKKGIRYQQYATIKHPPKSVAIKNGLSKRGEEVLKVMSLNLERQKPFSSKSIRKVFVVADNSLKAGSRINPSLEFVKTFYRQLHRYIHSKPALEFTSLLSPEQLRGMRYPIPDVADIIIVSVGEKYKGIVDQDSFGKPYEKLLANLRQYYPSAKIFCLSYQSSQMPLISKIADDYNAKIVDVSGTQTPYVIATKLWGSVSNVLKNSDSQVVAK
ncbi:MAG: cellulase family glycosylhydrolase [Victivallales bacterium]|nr:cellulase family glycosylhydrolase [Victivallales bacterium]